MKRINWDEVLSRKNVEKFVAMVLIAVVLFGALFFGKVLVQKGAHVLARQIEAENAPKYSTCDYGIFDISKTLIMLRKPTNYAGVFSIELHVEGSDGMFFHFFDEEEAWTCYSILRMLYGAEVEEDFENE